VRKYGALYSLDEIEVYNYNRNKNDVDLVFSRWCVVRFAITAFGRSRS